MKGLTAWIVFGFAAFVCLFWVSVGVRDDLREDDVFNRVLEERLDMASGSAKELYIGVAGDWATHPEILKGAQLAATWVNEKGGVLGRKVVLVPRDDRGSEKGALEAAQSFASDPRIPFVVGHTSVPTLAEVAQNYAFYGVLALSPNTPGMAYTDNTFPLIFGNALDSAMVSRSALDMVRSKGWKRVGLVYAEGFRGARLAREFESQAEWRGLRVVLSYGYGKKGDVAKHMDQWRRELGLDAMVLAVGRNKVLPLVSACRAVGLDCPFVIIGDFPHIAEAKRKFYGTLYYGKEERPAGYKVFVDRYRAEFNQAPGVDALFGCDAVRLLAGAAGRAGTCEPEKVAAALHEPAPESLTGTVRFNAHGGAVKPPPQFVRF
ncbi:ABC transporter substrate-binding protein [Pseudodesulfovibrio sp.]|uniref:ABC transporter substrate-binding protein n=1 Tax=unclassified Pseudodesulfovibrio TaxID=2661612 RepID=UPI003B00264E